MKLNNSARLMFVDGKAKELSLQQNMN